MSSILRSGFATVAVLAIGTSGVVAAPAPGASAAAYATIEGSGSTDAQLLVNQWIADVDPSGIHVVYSASGSSAGQHDFEQGLTHYAVVNRPEQVADGREHAAVPLVASGLALTYRLSVDGREVTGLRLSSDSVVGIFTGSITRWNDAAIRADNPGLALPATAITPVVRSDASATTGLLTSWLEHEQPAAWTAYTGGDDTGDLFPAGPTMRQANSSPGVIDAVSGPAGEGSIGYVPSTYALDAGLPEVKVLNHGGYYVAPAQYGVAIALRGAELADDGSAGLTGVFDHPDRRAYPLSSFISAVIPTASTDARMTTAKRQSLVDFLYHSVCEGQVKAGPYGYTPLTLNLVEASVAAIARLHDADPAVEVTDRTVHNCRNPTFDGRDPSRDVLDEQAPYSPTCDARGRRVCGAPDSTLVRLAAPVRDGVRVLRDGRAYLVTVRTTTSARPRYYPPVAPGQPLRPGPLLVAAAQQDGVRTWKRWVRPQPTDLRTWRLGVRTGSRTTVVAVRLQR